MSNKGQQTLKERARRAMLQHAFLRWESAVVISLTLLLTVFGSDLVTSVPNWLFLLGGVIAEAALVYSSYTDPETGRKVVAKMLHDEFQPERLHDRELQQKIEEALDYRSRIEQAIRDRRDSVLKDNLSKTAEQIDDWLENVYNLALRLDRYRSERETLERDRSRATERIRQLERKSLEENSAEVIQQIEVTVEDLRRQTGTIERLENTMERAQLQFESTLSKLGTIYTQTMLVEAKDIDSGRAKRLRHEISEEVQELDSVLLAMDEVYASGSQG